MSGEKAQVTRIVHPFAPLYDASSRIPAIILPSTSPANAAWSEQKLVVRWSCIREYL